MAGYGTGYSDGGYGGGYQRPGKRARVDHYETTGGPPHNNWKEMVDNWNNGGQPPAPGTSSAEKRMEGASYGWGRGGEDKPPCPYRLKHPDQPCLNYEVCSNYYDHGQHQHYCKSFSSVQSVRSQIIFYLQTNFQSGRPGPTNLKVEL